MNNLYVKLKFLTFLDHEASAVSSSKRMVAYLADWFLGSLATLLPICLLWTALTGDVESMSQVSLFTINSTAGKMQAVAAGAAGLVLALWYYVFIPWKVTPGQTPGKKMMNIRIAKKDGSALRLKDLLIRQVLGFMLLEGMLCTASSLFHEWISLATGLNFTGILMMASLIITIASILAALLAPSSRMIHDYMAGTVLENVENDRPDQQI